MNQDEETRAKQERDKRIQAALEEAERLRGLMGDEWADGMYE